MSWLDIPPSIRSRTASDFSLPALQGRRVRRSAFRQRKRLVLAFVHPPSCEHCRSLVTTLARENDALAKFETQVLLLVATNDADAVSEWRALPFPTLLDAGAATRRRYEKQLGIDPAEREALLVTLDEFGAIQAAYRSAPEETHVHWLGPLKDELSALYYDCPE